MNWPIEGLIKVLATTIAVIFELFASTDYGGGPGIVYIGDIQHATMYMFFMISGIVDILLWKGGIDIPNLDYVALASAFGVEGLLFYNHLGGRTLLDSHLHGLLLLPVAGCVLGCILEVIWRQSLLTSLLRPFSVLLQGSWIIQAGFILNPPSPIFEHWSEDDHEQIMLTTLMFTWHAISIVIVMSATSIISRLCTKKHCLPQTGSNYEMMDNSLLPGMPQLGSLPRDMTSQYRVDGRDDEMMRSGSMEESDESIEEFSTHLTRLT